jgi:PAS domain S-box-containing protein
MTISGVPLTAPFLIVAVLLFSFAAYSWRQGQVPGARALGWLALAVGIWLFTAALERNAVVLSEKLFWLKVQSFGIVITPAAWLVFAVRYGARSPWFTRRRIMLLLAPPLLTLLLAWTNHAHGLIWAQIEPIRVGERVVLALRYGPAFWLHSGYFYLSLLLGTLLLIRLALLARAHYHWQISILLLSALAPWAANILFAFRSAEGPLDLTPFGFSLSVVLLGWSLFRYHLLAMVPLAHDAVLLAMHDGVIVLDGQRQVVDMNPAAERAIGIPAATARGQTLRTVIPHEAFQSRQWMHRQDLQDEVQLAVDAQVRTYKVQMTPLQDRSSLMVGRLIILHDITERKQAEQATAQLLAELRASEQAAEAATRAKSEFLAHMSHEIRTPITGVIGVYELLQRTHLSTKQALLVELARTSGKALLAVIDDILDFSKIESGKLDLHPEPFELHRCMEDALDLVALKADEKGLDLVYELARTTPPRLFGDCARLRQILLNLLSNAVKFTERGSICLEVGARPLDARRIELTFTVEDTGIGIPAHRRSDLFQPFTQLAGASSEHPLGTGLGLALSKRLSELMGGTMWVDSTPGAGSAFKFTVVMETLSSPPHPLHTVAPELTGKRILMVGLPVKSGDMLRRLVEDWGLTVVDSGTIAEALHRLQEPAPVDLALVGAGHCEAGAQVLEFAEQVHRQPGTQALPLLLVASLQRSGVDIDIAQQHFQHILRTPVKAGLLLGAVRNLVTQTPFLRAAPLEGPFSDGQKRAGGARSVLLAEDDPTTLMLTMMLLEELGEQVTAVTNGQAALAAVRERNYDLALLDIQMPELDGLAVARRIRSELPAAQQPYLIALTANTMQGDRERYLSVGMDDYVSKPLTLQDLESALARASTVRASRHSELPQERPVGDSLQPTRPADSPSHQVTQQVLQRVHTVGLTGGDAAQLWAGVVREYLRDAPAQLAVMETGVRCRDYNQVVQAAHRLKSSSAMVGFTTLAQLCDRLEQGISAGQTRDVEQQVQQIQAIFLQAEADLAAAVTQ